MIDIPDNILPKNEHGEEVCPRCQKSSKECVCPAYDPNLPKVEAYLLRLRLEKSGRRGKTVTCIEGFPADEAFLKNIAKKLKSKTGSGGTHYIQEGRGCIEIQGDQREKVKAVLFQEGFKL